MCTLECQSKQPQKLGCCVRGRTSQSSAEVLMCILTAGNSCSSTSAIPRAHFSANCPNDPVAKSPGVESVIAHSMLKVLLLSPNCAPIVADPHFQTSARHVSGIFLDSDTDKHPADPIIWLIDASSRPVRAPIKHPIAGNHVSGNQVFGAFLQIGALKAAFFVHYLQKCTICRHHDQAHSWGLTQFGV